MAQSGKIRVKKTKGPPYYITLYGTTHPPGIKLNISDAPSVTYEEKDLGYTLNFKVSISSSRIIIPCEIDKLVDDYLIHIIIRAGDAAKALVDLMCFSLGLGVLVTFDKYKDIDGEIKTVSYIDNRLSSLCTAFNGKDKFSEIIKIVLEDPPLFMALNDLILANTLPHYVPANCGRTVEGIRHLIAGAGTDAKKAWPVMKTALNIDKSFMDIIINNAMPYRHGNRVPISPADTHLILSRSWQIMDRYLHLRLRNIVSLPDSEFPLLVG